MNRRLPVFAVVLVTLLTTWPASSEAAREFYSLSRSIRALGMGGAFYGLSDDENAVFYNPAGLAFYEGGNDFMGSLKLDGSTNMPSAIQTLVSAAGRGVANVLSDLQAYQGNPITADITPLYAYYLKKYFSAGLLVADTKGAMALLGADLDTTADLTVISDTGLFVGFGLPVWEGLAIGANLKGMFRAGGHKTYTVLEIAQNSGFNGDITTLGGVGGGVDFDLGATYQLPTIIEGVVNRLSIVASNVMASQFTLVRLPGYNAPPGLPRLLTIAGYTRLPGFWKVNHVNLLVDVAELQIGGHSDANEGARTGSFWKHLNLGVEGKMFGWLTGRMGLHQGNFTIGVGFDARFFQMDIATYAEEMASLPGRLSSRRVALRLAAGFGGADPVVKSATSVTTPAEPLPTLKPAPKEIPEAATPATDAAPKAPEEPHGQNDSLGVDKITEVSLR